MKIETQKGILDTDDIADPEALIIEKSIELRELCKTNYIPCLICTATPTYALSHLNTVSAEFNGEEKMGILGELIEQAVKNISAGRLRIEVNPEIIDEEVNNNEED